MEVPAAVEDRPMDDVSEPSPLKASAAPVEGEGEGDRAVPAEGQTAVALVEGEGDRAAPAEGHGDQTAAKAFTHYMTNSSNLLF